jgi:para-nitrobenzyl esterase
LTLLYGVCINCAHGHHSAHSRNLTRTEPFLKLVACLPLQPHSSTMKSLSHRLAIAALFCIAATNSSRAAIEYANITGGRVQGEVQDRLTSFKGLPFAAPPVGALRWKIPQPVIGWSGVRKADIFAPACIQPWAGNPDPSLVSEDCLYLNVWTAAATAKERRPVMVWIHGGGLTGGMSWEHLSYGTKLAPEGVVLVTIAYRLGAFGFLAAPELTRESGQGSGNYGLFDTLAALKWVHANIAQFGGDPNRVTIFGGSSGGHIVSLLAGAPAAKGLYQRAIAQGGVLFYPTALRYPRPLADMEHMGEDFIKSLGVSNLKSARNLPADAILKAPEPEAGFRATIDGSLIVGLNEELFQQARFNDTPILVGFNTDEVGTDPPKQMVELMESVIGGSDCKPARAAIANAYPRTNDVQTSMLRYLYRDFYVGWPTREWARQQSIQGHNHAYVYIFDVHGPEHPFGAWHATEYPFVFGNFPIAPTRKEEAISTLMRKYWTNFAAHGDPNGPGLPIWKAFDRDSQMAMLFSDSSHSQPLPNIAGFKALDALLRCAKPENESSHTR